jgi:hypothetical protein
MCSMNAAVPCFLGLMVMVVRMSGMAIGKLTATRLSYKTCLPLRGTHAIARHSHTSKQFAQFSDITCEGQVQEHDAEWFAATYVQDT